MIVVFNAQASRLDGRDGRQSTADARWATKNTKTKTAPTHCICLFASVWSRFVRTWTDQPAKSDVTAKTKDVMSRDEGCVCQERRKLTSWKCTSWLICGANSKIWRWHIDVYFFYVCVIFVPWRGAGTVDGGIWKASEVSGSHQLGMYCQCGVWP